MTQSSELHHRYARELHRRYARGLHHRSARELHHRNQSSIRDRSHLDFYIILARISTLLRGVPAVTRSPGLRYATSRHIIREIISDGRHDRLFSLIPFNFKSFIEGA